MNIYPVPGADLTFSVPLVRTLDNVELEYNATNLQLTANKLNTIQDIATTSSPTFAGLTVGGSTGVGLTASNGVLTLTGKKAGGNNENLIFDFESTANRVSITSGTGVSVLRTSEMGLLMSGATGGVTTSGAGTRLIWAPAKAAFRAGLVAGTEWNDANVGASSVAFGNYNISSGYASFSEGQSCNGLGSFSVAMGQGCNASGYGAVAMGDNENADSVSFVAGTGVADAGYGQVVLGYCEALNTHTATGTGSVAIGQNVNATTNDNVLCFGKDFTGTVASSFNIGFGQLDYQFTATAADFKDSNFVTTGTIGGGAITGTSFIIGANTLTTAEWAYLDGVNQTLATTSSPTFANVTDSGITATHIVYGGTAGLLSGSANMTFTNNATATLAELLCAGNLSAGAFLKIPTTTSTVGQILQNGVCILHTKVPTNQAASYKNIFIGESSGNFTMTNITQPYEGCGNVGIGAGTLDAVTSGYYNFALGTDACGALTTGNSNVCIGQNAGLSSTNGAGNAYIGRSAGSLVTSGNFNNIGIGYDAIRSCAGTGTVAIGFFAGRASTTANYNIYLGYYAGWYQTTADSILLIANQDYGSAAAELTNSIMYGIMAATTAAQTFRVNANGIYSTFGTNSATTLTLRTNNDQPTYESQLVLQKSNSDTADAVIETADGDELGTISVQGVSSTPAVAPGFKIRVVQGGASGAGLVPTNAFFETYTSAGANTGQLTLYNDSNVGINKAIPTVALDVVGAGKFTTSLTAGTGFGCNSKAAQTAYVSGGALSAYSAGTCGYDTDAHAQEIHTLLTNIRAALVANGIMS